MTKVLGPVWLMQPIPYFGEKLEGEWIFEPKYDGWRIQFIKCSNGEIKIFGRRLEKNPDWTQKLSYLLEKINKILPNGSILDAELCSDKGRRFIPSLFSSTPKVKPKIFVFDVIYLNNEFLGNKKLEERKSILKKEICFEEPFYYAEFDLLRDINKSLKIALEQGHEGIVIKKLGSFYIISKDAPTATADWRKIKP
jgi:ATP-dependent DNA ligase